MSRVRSASAVSRRRQAARRRSLHRRARRTVIFCVMALAATLWAVGLPGRREPAPAPTVKATASPATTPLTDENADARRADILQDTSGTWPESLQALLERHPDALEFVEGYPDHKDDAPAETIGDVVQGQFPLLLQWDARWGYVRYGDDLLAVTGCGPTCLAMAAAGLTGDNAITPAAVAE